jgi:non-ribosomal peptide synthetase component E (peptide arylation enzyme)
VPEPPQQARLATLAGLIAAHASSAGGKSGLVHGGRTWSYADLDAAAVAMSAMVGAADPYEGEVPIAFVVTRPVKIVSAAELTNFLAERITAYKIQHGSISKIICRSLPATRSHTEAFGNRQPPNAQGAEG